jgi:hypothetical protein
MTDYTFRANPYTTRIAEKSQWLRWVLHTKILLFPILPRFNRNIIRNVVFRQFAWDHLRVNRATVRANHLILLRQHPVQTSLAESVPAGKIARGSKPVAVQL